MSATFNFFLSKITSVTKLLDRLDLITFILFMWPHRWLIALWRTAVWVLIVIILIVLLISDEQFFADISRHSSVEVWYRGEMDCLNTYLGRTLSSKLKNFLLVLCIFQLVRQINFICITNHCFIFYETIQFYVIYSTFLFWS